MVSKLVMREGGKWLSVVRILVYIIPFGNPPITFQGSVYRYFPLQLSAYEILIFCQKKSALPPSPQTTSRTEDPTLLPGITLNTQKILPDTLD